VDGFFCTAERLTSGTVVPFCRVYCLAFCGAEFPLCSSKLWSSGRLLWCLEATTAAVAFFVWVAGASASSSARAEEQSLAFCCNRSVSASFLLDTGLGLGLFSVSRSLLFASGFGSFVPSSFDSSAAVAVAAATSALVASSFSVYVRDQIGWLPVLVVVSSCRTSYYFYFWFCNCYLLLVGGVVFVFVVGAFVGFHRRFCDCAHPWRCCRRLLDFQFHGWNKCRIVDIVAINLFRRRRCRPGIQISVDIIVVDKACSRIQNYQTLCTVLNLLFT